MRTSTIPTSDVPACLTFSECLYRRAEECLYRRAEEEEDIQRRSSDCSQDPPCPAISASSLTALKLHTPMSLTSPASTNASMAAHCQGLTLVHFSAQRKRFLRKKGCLRGCLGVVHGGGGGGLQGFRGCFECQRRLRLS